MGSSKGDSEGGQLLTVTEAAEYLGVGESAIWRWMAEGALSCSWVKGACRLTRTALDAAARACAEEDAAGVSDEACAVCGRGPLIEGHVQDLGRIYFRPSRTRFWVLHEAVIPVAARMCAECGHVDLVADTRKLRRLMPASEAEEG